MRIVFPYNDLRVGAMQMQQTVYGQHSMPVADVPRLGVAAD